MIEIATQYDETATVLTEVLIQLTKEHFFRYTVSAVSTYYDHLLKLRKNLHFSFKTAAVNVLNLKEVGKGGVQMNM